MVNENIFHDGDALRFDDGGKNEEKIVGRPLFLKFQPVFSHKTGGEEFIPGPADKGEENVFPDIRSGKDFLFRQQIVPDAPCNGLRRLSVFKVMVAAKNSHVGIRFDRTEISLFEHIRLKEIVGVQIRNLSNSDVRHLHSEYQVF